MKPHLSPAKAFTVPIASVGQVPPVGHGLVPELDPGQAQEEAASMPRDQVSPQPSPRRPTVHQATAVDTDELESRGKDTL